MNMTETPKRRNSRRVSDECKLSDDENEVFFGEVTHKEEQKAVKYSRRRTVLYIPGFRKNKSLMRYSQELTPDGPFIYAREEITSDVCVTTTTTTTTTATATTKEPLSQLEKRTATLVAFTSDSDIAIKDKESITKRLFTSESETSVAKDTESFVKPRHFLSEEASVVKTLFPVDMSASCPVGSTDMSASCPGSAEVLVEAGDDCRHKEGLQVDAWYKPAEMSSRLMVDSGVDCCVGDSVLCSSRLSESTSSRLDPRLVTHGTETKPAQRPSEEMEVGFVRAQPQACVQVNTSSVYDNIVSNHALRNYAGSFLSDMDQTDNISDASDLDDFKKPFRLQGVFNGVHTCHTNMSTPRVASAVPNLSFSSPHMLVSPIASYRSECRNKDSDSSASVLSSASTPSRLVLSTASAFSRVPAATAVRRSLRKKNDNELSELTSVTSDVDLTKDTESSCVGDSNIQSSSSGSVCCDVGDSSVQSSPSGSVCCDDKNSSAVSPKVSVVSTSTQCDYLLLPSTLEGQQLMMVKSAELSKTQLESSPESLVSQSSWADLKLSALGINRERLCLTQVSSDSSSINTQSGTSSLSNVQKPDLVTDSDRHLATELSQDDVLESLSMKSDPDDARDCSPSTEYELGMNSEYFSINDQDGSPIDPDTPDLYNFKSHQCQEEIQDGTSEKCQSQSDGSDEDSDLDIEETDLDTVLQNPDVDYTLVENDYSPVKGRGYERMQKQLRSRPGMVWPNRYMSDSESSDIEELGERSFESTGSSDSSLLEENNPEASFEAVAVSPPPPPQPTSTVSLNDGKLKPWRPPGHVDITTKKASEGKFLSRTGFQARLRKIKEMTVKGGKKGSSFKFKGMSSNKENQITKKYPKSPMPKGDKSDKTKKSPYRRRKKSDMTEVEIDQMTQVHTVCNGQRMVRYLNFSESPMIIKHYPAPKEASKLCWSENIAFSSQTCHTPTVPPSRPKPKPILAQRPHNHTFPYSDDAPSPIILTRTRRTNTLSHRVTQL